MVREIFAVGESAETCPFKIDEDAKNQVTIRNIIRCSEVVIPIVRYECSPSNSQYVNFRKASRK